jgi:four helix bundle protein
MGFVECVHWFDHENLDVYRLALEVARWFSTVAVPRGRASLKKHGRRAADSVVPNIAEGRARGGGAGKNHFRIALGSAAELCAVLDLVQAGEAAYFQQRLRRIGAMLARMSR